MEQHQIEKIDQRRYRLLISQAVSFALIIPMIIFLPYVPVHGVRIILVSFMAVAILVFVPATFLAAVGLRFIYIGILTMKIAQLVYNR